MGSIGEVVKVIEGVVHKAENIGEEALKILKGEGRETGAAKIVKEATNSAKTAGKALEGAESLIDNRLQWAINFRLRQQVSTMENGPTLGSVVAFATFEARADGKVGITMGKEQRIISEEEFNQLLNYVDAWEGYRDDGGKAITSFFEDPSLLASNKGEPVKFYTFTNEKNEKCVARMIGAEELRYYPKIKVVPTDATRYVTPIPKMNGKPFSYTAYDNTTVTGEGKMFRNLVDNANQYVSTKGDGVLIFNQVTKEQADGLSLYLSKNPIKTADDIDRFLSEAEGLGIKDRYNSDVSYVKGNMIPVDNQANGVSGLHVRKKDTISAQFVPGSVAFEGAAGSPQAGSEGLYIVDQKRAVQPNIFWKTYRSAD